MTSALSPRDIQARIRSGASLEDVAGEAEVPVDKIEPFAAPVIAEREHMARTALGCPVRRRGETGSVRAMRAVAAEKLATLGIDPDDVEWDAWRNEDRRWTVQGRFTVETPEQPAEHTVARFVFDPRARFSVAGNDEARWLIGEVGAAQALGRPEPVDAEPTIDLTDELALVNAVQGRAPLVGEPVVEEQAPVFDVASRRPEPSPEQASREAAEDGQVAQDTGDELEAEDYSPAELEQVDGVYDFVPQDTSEMDVLYEMLSSFAEDSVNIYAGLSTPVTQDPQAGAFEEEPEPEALEVLRPHPEPNDEVSHHEPEPEALEVLRPHGEPEQLQSEQAVREVEVEPEALEALHTPREPAGDDAAQQEQPQQEHEPEPEALEVLRPHDEPEQPEAPATTAATPVVAPAPDPQTGPTPQGESTPQEGSEPAAQAGPHLEQGPDLEQVVEVPDGAPVATPADTVVVEVAQPAEQDVVEVPASTPAQRPKPKPRARKKRASVPSWDEIMFGGPTRKD